MKIQTFLIASLCSLGVMAQNQDSIKTSQMDEILVTGTRHADNQHYLVNTVSVVNRDVLTETQRTNILPTLSEQVPGIFITQRGVLGFGVSGGAAGGISIRGLGTGVGQALILIDGHPQYQGVFGHGIADAYQTMMVDKVEVLRGPASLLYGGNAMGGVINIVTRGMHEDGVRTHVNLSGGSYGTWQAEASNLVKAGKFTSTVAAQYSRTDGHRERMQFEQYGGYLKLQYRFNDNWNIFADGNITHFNASNPGSEKNPLFEADQWITRAAAAIGVENHYDKVDGRLSVYDNFGFHKINDGYGLGKKPQTELFRSKDAVAGVNLYETLNLFRGSHITLGFDYQHIYGRAYYTDRETGAVVTDRNNRAIQSAHAHNNEFAGYVDVRQDFTKWLTINAGVRYDHHSVAGGEWIPQAGVVFRPLKTAEVKLTASKGFRNPTNKELYLYKPANHDSLRAERLWNYELAWNHRVLDGRLRYGVNVFYMKGDNMIQTVAARNVNTGEIENCGAELEASWQINSHWTVSTNHSYLHMRYEVHGTPEYKGFIGATMKYGKWSANLGVQQVNNLYVVDEKDSKKFTKENFTLVNAGVKLQATKLIAFWLRGENLLNQLYQINDGYPMPRATVMGGVNITF